MQYESLDDVRDVIHEVFENERMIEVFWSQDDKEHKYKIMRPCFEKVVEKLKGVSDSISPLDIGREIEVEDEKDRDLVLQALSWMSSGACPLLEPKAEIMEDGEPVQYIEVYKLSSILHGGDVEVNGFTATPENVSFWFEPTELFNKLIKQDRM
jgi:hypothetical protein